MSIYLIKAVSRVCNHIIINLLYGAFLLFWIFKILSETWKWTQTRHNWLHISHTAIFIYITNHVPESARILDPPGPGSMQVRAGTTVSLSCRAAGHPQPQVTWTKVAPRWVTWWSWGAHKVVKGGHKVVIRWSHGGPKRSQVVNRW